MGWYWHRADYTPAPTFRRRITGLLRRRRPGRVPDLAASPRAGRIRAEDRRAVLLRRSPLRWSLALAAWGWLAWAVVTGAEDPSLWFYLFWFFLLLGPWLAVFSPSAAVRLRVSLAMIVLAAVYGLALDRPVRGLAAYLVAVALLVVNALDLRRRRDVC